MPRQLTIPIQLLELSLKNSLLPELKVFLGAKMVSPGYISDKSKEFYDLCNLVGLQRRTVLKHLDHLVRMQWIGYDRMAMRYYFRSWAWFRSREIFYERVSVSFMESDMQTFREFVAGAVIGNHIKKQEHFIRKQEDENSPYQANIRKKIRKSVRGKASKSVTNIGRVTAQDFDTFPAGFTKSLTYYGFSNAHIAKILHCGETNACNLKHEAEKAGYLKTTPKVKIIQPLPSGPDYSIRYQYYRAFGEDACKLRFSTECIDGKKILCLVQQLHDEITPLLSYKRIKYLKQLHKKRLNEHRPSHN